MIKPSGMLVKCTVCYWHKTIAPQSDVLTIEDLPPKHCPKCGSEDLDVEQAQGVFSESIKAIRKVVKQRLHLIF